MDHLNHSGFITTKEAAKIADYSPDYLARLLRAGDIQGIRQGRSWLVDPTSLERYLNRRHDRNVRRATGLSHARRVEYQTTAAIPHFFTPPAAAAALSMGQVRHMRHTGLPRAAALTAALIVVSASSLLARSAVIPDALVQGWAIAGQTAFGSTLLLESLSGHMRERIAHVRDARAAAESAVLARPGAYAPAIPLVQIAGAGVALSQPRVGSVKASAETDSGVRALYAIAQATSAAVYNPQAMLPVIAASYSAAVQSAGEHALIAGATARDGLGQLSALPTALLATHIAFGHAVITFAHGAIALDVRFAYAVADTAPEAAGKFVAITDDITRNYLAFLQETGRLAYGAFTGARGVSSETAMALSTLSAALAGVAFSADDRSSSR